MRHHSSSNVTCPVANQTGPSIIPIAGDLHFHGLSIIISGATCLVASLIALFLIIRHATHFSNPAEQKQIMRILCIVPYFAILSFISVWLPGTAQYLKPGLGVAEAFPLAAFFLLMSTYCVPDEDLRSREAYFSQLELKDKKGNVQGGGSLAWYRNRSIAVLQFIPISILLWIITAITLAEGSYCELSNRIHFAHIWTTVINVFSTTICIMSILGFYGRMKPILRPHKTVAKLFSFKILVALNFLQTTIFSLLNSSGDLKPTKYLTYSDISTGLPNLILSIELLLLSPFLAYAYSVRPYKLSKPSSASGPTPLYYKGGPGGMYAIFAAMNIIDIFMTMVQGIKGKVSDRSRGARGYELGRERVSHDGQGYNAQVPPSYTGYNQGVPTNNGYQGNDEYSHLVARRA